MYLDSNKLLQVPALHPRPVELMSNVRQRSLRDFVVLFACVMTLAIVTLVAGWQLWHEKRIYSGVTVAGVAVGGLTRAGAIEHLRKDSASLNLPNVMLTLDAQRWSPPEEQMRRSVDWLAAVNQAYLIGRQEPYLGTLHTQTAAIVGAVDIEPQLHFDSSELYEFVRQVAAEVHQPGHPAIMVDGLEIAAQPGLEVNIADTIQRIEVALREQQQLSNLEVPLAVTQVSPLATTQDMMAQDNATQGVNGTHQSTPFMLDNAPFQLRFAIDAPMWRNLVMSEQPLRLDEAHLETLLQAWSRQVDVTARDARLHFDTVTREITVLQESLPGRRLDIEATVGAIRTAATAGQMRADLVIIPVLPAVDSTRIAEMGIQELVMSSTTYFAGSTQDRIHNIEVAAEQFEGVVIPPDGIFSFNDLVGDVSAANGFEDSLIIWGDRTAVGIGGGVCQVSTTIFRAAYEAGMPIVERYNHGYVVDWYGDPGFDATIFTPTVDFRFRNDTGAHLLIDPVVDLAQGTMTFNLYGTKPDRQVTIHEPVITNYTEPGEPQYIVDASLAPGEQRQVEWPQAGMTVTVQRTIVEQGQTRTDTITSIYQPWRALYLVGPEATAAAPDISDRVPLGA